MKFLDKIIKNKENKYILYSGIFAIIYFFVLLPAIIDKFDGNNPLLQFIIFDLGIMILLTIYFKSKTLNTKIDLVRALEYTLVITSMDIWMPEYHVALNGSLIQGGVLGVSASDYFFGWIGQNIGLNNFLITIPSFFVNIFNSIFNFVNFHLPSPFTFSLNYMFAYFVVPISLLYLAKNISKSNFVKNL